MIDYPKQGLETKSIEGEVGGMTVQLRDLEKPTFFIYRYKCSFPAQFDHKDL